MSTLEISVYNVFYNLHACAGLICGFICHVATTAHNLFFSFALHNKLFLSFFIKVDMSIENMAHRRFQR